MTPLALEMLIWFHTRGAAAGAFPRIELKPQLEVVNWFLDEDIIEPHDGASPQYTYRTTEKGAAWLGMMLETPMPRRVWVDPRRAA